MNLTKKIIIFILAFSLWNLSIPTSAHSEGSTNNSAQTTDEEFGPLQIVIQDLQDSINLINEEDKKTALTILKSAIKELREIDELTPMMVKGMGARLKKAIRAVKKGDNAIALSEINHVLSELQSF